MKLFLDTAEISEINAGAKTGLIDGITTNPSLLAKSGRSFANVVKDITKIIDGPISLEVLSTTTDKMLKEGRVLAKLHPNIVVKLPMTMAAMPVVKQLRSENIPVNVTLVFSANQALLAAKAGATYVSPFIGRLDDVGENGIELIHEILQVYQNYNITTQVLAASIRHVSHIRESAMAGAQVATLPYSVFEKLAQHPLTTSGLEQFLKDSKKIKQ